jgi:hypothetical protein
MRLFKVLCACVVVPLLWWLEISYVLPALPAGTDNGLGAAFASMCLLLLFCCGVTVGAFAYFITGWPTSVHEVSELLLVCAVVAACQSVPVVYMLLRIAGC